MSRMLAEQRASGNDSLPDQLFLCLIDRRVEDNQLDSANIFSGRI